MPRNRSNRDRRWVSLTVLCVGMLMIVLDNTVVNVALPSIQSDFGFTKSDLAWVVNAYMIAFGGVLLLAGRLGDLIGTKRVFMSGLVLFTLASLLCGVAWNRDTLIAFRFVQGLGGAMASPVVLAMIVTMFREPYERAKAMGVFSFTASAGGSIGLLIGGFITQAMNWHWVFLVNVPIGIVTLFVAMRLLEDRGGIGLRKGADALGSALITASLMLAVFTVVQIPTEGIASAQTLGSGAVALLLFAAFLVRESTAKKPLLPLAIFKSRNVTGSNLLQILIVASMFGFFFIASLYLRRGLHYNAVMTGLAFLPVTISIGAFSLGWAPRITTHFGPFRVVLAGQVLAVLGIGAFTLAPTDANYFAVMFPAMLALGIGLGVSFPAIMMFAMSDATGENSGIMSGLVNTTSNVGGALGLAVLATITAVHGYRAGFGAATVVIIIGGIVAAAILHPAALREHNEAEAAA